MTNLPEGWDEYNPNKHERSEEPSYRAARAAAAQRAERRRAAYGEALAALRRARSLTQVAVAQRLGVAQGEVSRIEHQGDLLLSTLARYIEGIDGEFSLLVRFGDGQTIEFTSVLEDLFGPEHHEDDVVAPDLANLIQLAGYRARYPYKEMEFRALATA
jgi:transcriptional regulator with XRE-family HTH domain